jgi:predicted DNA-binding antitoxin AbrB/MazE fold protein
MNTIRAIYENGVFRPVEPVAMPEHCTVILHAEVANISADQEQQDNAAIWAVLSQPLDAGEPRLSERHNEHQP